MSGKHSRSASKDAPTTNNEEEEEEDNHLKATLEMCVHCFDVLIHKLTTTSRSDQPERPVFVDQLPHSSIQCPLFVTWHIRNDEALELRGCIGTLTPRPLATSVGPYALSSAFQDRRFTPVTLPEIPLLCVSVSLLVQYETCEHCHDWIVGVHGILIQWSDDGEDYSATYLPEVAPEQGWDQRKTVQSLIRKAGYQRSVNDRLLRNIQCTRYQSSKQKLTYDEYVRHKGEDPVKEVLRQVLDRRTDKNCCLT